MLLGCAKVRVVLEKLFYIRFLDFFFNLSQLYYWRINAIVKLFISKHNVYKQKRRSNVLGKEIALGARGGGGERVALIKSLI